MKKLVPLTLAQQKLVEQHLSVVHWVIHESIHVNEQIYGLAYDDLYQEGSIWLCKAAVSFRAGTTKFSTYAKTVIRNGLISYCRQQTRTESRYCRLMPGTDGEFITDSSLPEQPDDFLRQISMFETLELLESRRNAYDGVARLGIIALELKIKGMSVSDIAALYHVPPAHVGAWISRSLQKLRNDAYFLSGIT